MILLWGLQEDTPMGLVRAALEKAGADVFFLDHRKIFRCEIECEFSAASDAPCSLTDGDRTICLQDIRAAYVRGFDFCDYDEMQGRNRDDPLAIKASGFETQLTAYLNASPALVLNRSEPSATNGSKPYQLSAIRKVGLRIPDTLLTNVPTAAKKFISANGSFIYKSISGVRSIVRKVSDTQRETLNDVEWCPTQFQKYLCGTNYRAHVLNGQVFTVRIESDEVDYRYGQSTMTPDALPVEVEQKCLELTARLGLEFSGIDLMRTLDDEWYCFEVNSSPAYSFFELGSGMPISRALAKFMMDADRQKRICTAS